MIPRLKEGIVRSRWDGLFLLLFAMFLVLLLVLVLSCHRFLDNDECSQFAMC